ncbi:MAG: HAD-IIB family hydrolase [Oscillospiraceae bacterium]
MGKFSGVLLASDYDDTLFSSKRTVSAENKTAIEYFMANGGYFSVATGRAHKTFTPQISEQEIPFNAPCVLSNGAGVYDYTQDKWLHLTTLPDRAVSDLRQLLDHMPALGIETYHEDEIYVCNPNDMTRHHMKRVCAQFIEGELEDLPRPWIKAIIEAHSQDLIEAQRYLLTHFGDFFEIIFSNHHLLEITAKGCHKGGMVRWIANYLGIAPGDVYCVGDNENDLSMLQVSAIPMAPANCAEVVKLSGARLVADCDHHTVADIVRILDEIYS